MAPFERIFGVFPREFPQTTLRLRIFLHNTMKVNVKVNVNVNVNVNVYGELPDFELIRYLSIRFS